MVFGIVTGDVYERSAATFIRQVVGEDGSLISPLDIASITYDVYQIPMTRERYQALFGTIPARDISLVPLSSAEPPEPITYGRELVVEEVILPDPLRDNRWTKDDIGFNFLVTLPPSDFPEIPLDNYPRSGWQEIWFHLTPYVGDAFPLGFVVRKNFSLGTRKTGSGSGSGIS